MKVPAIWDRAKAHGLKTAGASWPVTVGAGIDVLFPESNQAPPDSTWLVRARRESTPGLVDAVVAALGTYGENDNRIAIERDRAPELCRHRADRPRSGDPRQALGFDVRRHGHRGHRRAQRPHPRRIVT